MSTRGESVSVGLTPVSAGTGTAVVGAPVAATIAVGAGIGALVASAIGVGGNVKGAVGYPMRPDIIATAITNMASGYDRVRGPQHALPLYRQHNRDGLLNDRPLWSL